MLFHEFFIADVKTIVFSSGFPHRWRENDMCSSVRLTVFSHSCPWGLKLGPSTGLRMFRHKLSTRGAGAPTRHLSDAEF
jgi:hypothetical protein